jgi:penicillin amidase
MKALQGDLHSPLGAMLRDALVASLDRALEESRAPGAHPALADELSMAGAAGVARLQEARDRLAAWRFTTEPAVEGSPTAAQIEESVATVIFNTALVRILRGMLDDEIATIMRRPWGQPATKALTFALLAPSRMATFDADTGESILWDDTRTPAIETKDEINLRAFLAALQANATSSRLGPDMSAWRWGRLHTLRLPSLIPEIDQPLALPPTTGEFAAGWPRHGDLWGVDASNFDAWTSSDNFAYGSGPQQRLVVEMTDTGPRIWNALPGGNVFDPRSPHYADEIELWRRNQAPALYFTDADVMAHAEETWRFTSAAD